MGEYVLAASIIMLVVVLAAALYVVVMLWKTWKKAKFDLFQNIDFKGTTQLPMPFAASTCKHVWEVVDRGVLHAPHEERFVLVQKCVLCGAIDKTIEVTSKMPPPPAPPKSECRHNWSLESTSNLESAYEQLIKGMKAAKKGTWDKKDEKKIDLSDNMAPWMFQKRHVEVRICTQCGEIDKTVVSNHDSDEEKEDL